MRGEKETNTGRKKKLWNFSHGGKGETLNKPSLRGGGQKGEKKSFLAKKKMYPRLFDQL